MKYRQPKEEDLIDVPKFKHVEYSKALVLLKDKSYISTVLRDMYSRITEFKEYQYVFVKVDNLKKDSLSTKVFRFHLDCEEPLKEIYDNYIFVSGNNPTLFCNEDVPFGINNVDRYVKEKRIKTFPINTCEIHKYKSSTPHKGVKATYEHRRLLVRLSNTNIRKEKIYGNT